ncbi:MAG: amino acid permease, partial [bacterium]
YHPFFSRGWVGFLATTAFVFVSYAGVTKVVSVAEEIKDPGRNIPWGIMLSLIVSVLIYTLVAYVVVGLVPADELGRGMQKLMPLEQAGRHLGGYWGMEIMAGIAVLALASMANAGLMAASRFPLPMARDNILPPALKKINQKFSTPVRSILLTGVILLGFIYFLPVKILVKLASAFLLMVFGLVNLALIIFRESEIEWYKPDFQSPGYPFLQIFGFISCFGLIFFMGWQPLLGAGLLIGGCLGWYFLYARHHTDRTGAFFRSPAVNEQEIQLFREARSGSSSGKESVIVPFFGLEEADMLAVEQRIKRAAALCDRGERLDVVDFIEVPEQAFLSGFEADEEAYLALKQRVNLLRGQIDNEIHVDQVITHHSRGALRNYAREEKPHWVVFDWQEPSPWQILIGNKQWWLEDFPCDILFYRNKNNLELGKVVVLTEPGHYDGEVVYAADHITGYEGSKVLFLNPVAPTRKAEKFVNSYQRELIRMCQSPAEAEKIPVENWVEGVLALLNREDLLVVGGLSADSFPHFSGKSRAEEIIERSECNVARVISNLRSPQTVMKRDRKNTVELADYFQDDSVVEKINASSKDSFFRQISEVISEETKVNPEKIEEALKTRERAQDTYIEDGLAFPHGILNGVDKTYLRIVVFAPPLDYTEEGKEVELCVVTVGPPDDRLTHLEIIGKMTRLLVENNLKEKLLNRTDKLAVLQEAVNDRGNST